MQIEVCSCWWRIVWLCCVVFFHSVWRLGFYVLVECSRMKFDDWSSATYSASANVDGARRQEVDELVRLPG